MAIDESRSYIATVTMAGGDTFTIELFPESAPLTVNNFVFLAEEGWFDGVTFHRVLPGFVAQTGDPTGTGLGNPGYTIPNEVDPDLSHADTGIVAMANSGPDTNGSQWYITLGDASYLDGGYTIFGRVTEGMNIVQAISPRDPNTGGSLPPGDVIESIVIEESN
ncbi:MAG: peptidylprolyl isomerase [Chloroflexota bacterium]